MAQHSYYEINVSFKGKHFFATAPRSLTYLREAEEAYRVLVAKFPESEGYKVTATHFISSGQHITFD